MKRQTLTVSYSRKVQLERYEPVEVGEEITVRLEDGDNPEAVRESLSDELQESVEQRILSRTMQKKMEDGNNGD
jgi:hypothetical protein